MKNKGPGNVTGLKFENRTRTQSRTRSPVWSSLIWPLKNECHDTKINNYNFAIVTNSTYFISGSVSPSVEVPSKATEDVKVWPIAVSVVAALVVVVLIVLTAIWVKRRWNRIPRFGYKKHEDDDMAPLETSMEL